MAIGDVVGTMTIEAVDGGGLAPYPRVSFAPVGLITSGWFDRYVPVFEREVEKAQSAVRNQRVSRVAPEDAVSAAAPRRRRA
jgi:hypothetical protein